LTAQWFGGICRRADRTFWSHDARSVAHNPIGKLAMKAIDTDRVMAATETGLYAYVCPSLMTPLDYGSPKNHILVGRRKY